MPFCADVSGDEFENDYRERAGAFALMLRRRCQSALDGTFESHAGRSLESVKAELVRRWQVATGGDDVAEPQLSAYAETISAGRRAEIETHER